jgi:uncharacterized membrane protein
MSNNRKILLGLLSILPIIMTVVYMAVMFSNFFYFFPHANNDQAFPEEFFRHFLGIFAIIILMSFLHIGLLIYYIIHLVNNNHIDPTERIVWILIFVFAGMVGFPIYWYMRIWRENTIG